MGAGGRTEETGGAGADNVIRFPRDWFGSKDDLVPFGPAADRLEAEAAAARAARGTAAPAEADAELASALNANDFWGGESGALHQPMDAVPEDDLALGVAPTPLAVAPSQEPLVLAVQPPLALAVAESAPRLPRASTTTRVRSPLQVGVGALVVVCALALTGLVLSRGGSGNRAGPRTAALATGPQTPVTLTLVGAADSLNWSDAALAHHVLTQTSVQTAAELKARKPRVAKTRHATRHTSVRHRAAVKHASGSEHTSSTDSTDAIESSTDATENSAVVSDSSPSVDSGAAVASDSSTAGSGSAGGGSSSSGSGPGGLGGAVGPTCNPNCSAQ